MASLAFFFAVLGILAGSYLSPAKASTSITVVPESQSVSEREDVTVNCTASANATNLNFTWTKVGDDKVLTYSNQLTLLDINLSDAGNYSCNATNGTANWNAVAIIMVTASPTISVVPNSQTVPEGNDVTVNCTVSENATNLNFTWTKVGDNNVLTYSNQLTLLNINLSDAGNYSCYATNEVVNLHAVATIMVTSSSIISVVPKSQTVEEGTDVTVNCTASVNATYLNFTWTKVGDVKASSNLLSLPNINRLDAGSYICHAINGTAQWQAVATINVTYPARIQSAGNQTVNESSTSELFCNASGNPSPNITWSLPNGSHIYLQGKDSLKITNTTRKAHGKYNCTASNGVGDSSSDVIYLNVQYKPAINTSGNVTEIESWLDHNSTLDCRADGNPSPKITWSRDDGNPLHSTTSGSISIIPKEEKDFGKYTCTAGNLLGKDQLSVELKRTAFPPSPPKILNTETELRNRSLTLRWSSSSDNGGRPILNYTVWHRVVFDHNTTKRSWIKTDAGKYLYYNLSLDWATSYHVAVTAVNDQGTSNKSDIKNFTVFPEPTPKASDPPTMSGIDGTNKKLTIGLSCGVTALVLVIVLIAFVVYRRQKRRQNTGDANSRFKSNAASTQGRNVYNVTMQDLSRSAVLNDTKEHEDEPLYSVSQPIYVNASYSEDERKNWEFPREKLHIQKKIGKGAFCVVAKAIADGLGTIAVKMPKENAPDSNKKDLLAEYELLQQMKPHPNVIQLLGAVTRTDPILVMFEYIPYGDLLGFLRRSRGLDDNYFKDPDVQPSSSLKSQQLLKFAREVADGMAHLSANKIIHRDLAARNVLVGEGETCKITDFGMARDVQRDDIYQKRTRGRLPVKWTAYESLLYGFATTQSDVWSYGVVLYEIFTIGGCPYPKIEPHRIPYMIKDGYRMPQPAHLDDEIYALMCECWKTEPELRPTFQFISSTIKRLERSHKDVIYINVYNESLYDNVGDWD